MLSGTFHRGQRQLANDFRDLISAGCEVLSPKDIEFVKEVDGFVLAAHEVDEDPRVIEQRHLAALQEADLVWLHAPEGYIGASAAMEVGVAHALGIPVLAQEQPVDITFRSLVRVFPGIEEAIQWAAGQGTHTPSRPLRILQDYYERVAASRGYAKETAQDTLLLLTEEIGELARAVRKEVGLARADGFPHEDAAAELADVQLYLLHLANILGVSLGEAVASKERYNAERLAARAAAA
ncbi:MAG TPA: MazG nucleotide pyrophosphohydrolase domain-containing protein [Thermoleophilaceae bacterium]